jgi:hypothetical protein
MKLKFNEKKINDIANKLGAVGGTPASLMVFTFVSRLVPSPSDVAFLLGKEKGGSAYALLNSLKKKEVIESIGNASYCVKDNDLERLVFAVLKAYSGDRCDCYKCVNRHRRSLKNSIKELH